MKTVIALIVSLLFISSFGAHAASFAEVEIELQKRANNFNAHPLREYLVPEGHLVLFSVFSKIKSYCIEKSKNSSQQCISGRENAAILLINSGFARVTPNDFNSSELKNLSKEIIDFAINKKNAYRRAAREAKTKNEKFAWQTKSREFNEKSSALRDHFNDSRKKPTSAIKSKSSQSNASSLDELRAADKERAQVTEIPSILK